MIGTFESAGGQAVSLALAMALAGPALAGCGVIGNSPDNHDGPVRAVVDSHGRGGTVAKLLISGKTIELYDGTEIEAICVSGQPFNLEAEVVGAPDGSKRTGTIVYDLPRADLNTTTGSYGDNSTGQDRFDDLRFCDES